MQEGRKVNPSLAEVTRKVTLIPRSGLRGITLVALAASRANNRMGSGGDVLPRTPLISQGFGRVNELG